jgi:hypothetical protein
MKTAILCCLLALAASAGAADAPYVTFPDRMLAAIAAVETGNQARAIGAMRERSAWQLTEATWKRYTREPFEKATTDPELARIVALANLARIGADLARQGRPLTAFNIARRWNPHAGVEYAQRVANVFATENTKGTQRVRR